MSTQAATKPSLTLKRRFKAPPAKVFAAWTEPEKIKRWFGPGRRRVHPRGVRPACRRQIHYRGDRRRAARPTRFWASMREVVPGARLVYTWAWASTPERESLVTVVFKPEGDGTLLTLTHAQFFDEDARDRHQQGWAGALDKMEKFFA